MHRLLFLLALAVPLQAQWQIQRSNTTADLRGIHAIGNAVAWASGSKGTVLRTTDNGRTWQACATPPGAEALDFRGVQAFDAQTAIVMSSGKGDLSRLYKTADGCKTWKLVATNPDKDGFWDAVQADVSDAAYILGDSVQASLRIWEWKEGWEERELELSYQMKGSSASAEGSFAASNSIFQIVHTEQKDPNWKYAFRWSSGSPGHAFMSSVRDETTHCEPCLEEKKRVDLPILDVSNSAGIFSFNFRDELVGVAVGGNYAKPAARQQTSFKTTDGGLTWSVTPGLPHGYRSAVAYFAATKSWVTVGPNGTDVSTDDGRNWRALTPSAAGTPDEDKSWNALSLPFVVGPKGRIGILRPEALGKP